MARYWLIPVFALGFVFANPPANATAMYWNLFNLEGETALDSVFITYDSLSDMLTDSNRTGSFVPDTTGNAAQNVVGSGAFVMFVTKIPEPGTLALFGLGLAGFAFARRRSAAA